MVADGGRWCWLGFHLSKGNDGRVNGHVVGCNGCTIGVKEERKQKYMRQNKREKNEKNYFILFNIRFFIF